MRTVFMTVTGAAAALLVQAAPATAQLTYVSATGNDGNSCLVATAPCRTLQRGVNATVAGGELRVLSQMAGNCFINKSITIDAEGHTIVGTFIIGGAPAIVTFRNVVMSGRVAYPVGLDIRDASAVHIENSTVERYLSSGITFENYTGSQGIELTISNSVFRNSGGTAIRDLDQSPHTGVDMTIDGSRFENNDSVLFLGATGQATISRSVFAGNSQTAIRVRPPFGAANITNTIISDNGEGIVIDGGTLIMRSSVVRGNAFSGLFVGRNGSSPGEASIADSVFTDNDKGIYVQGAGSVVRSHGDNFAWGNATADVVEESGGDLLLGHKI